MVDTHSARHTSLWPPCQVEGIAPATMSRGPCQVEGLPHDVWLDGDVNRNRAFSRDVVALRCSHPATSGRVGVWVMNRVQGRVRVKVRAGCIWVRVKSRVQDRIRLRVLPSELTQMYHCGMCGIIRSTRAVSLRDQNDDILLCTSN